MTKKEMAKKWGLPPTEPFEESDKALKNNMVVVDPKDFKDELRKRTGIANSSKGNKSNNNKPPVDDFADLIDKSRVAELEQEISKAQTMKYKAEQERLKLMKQSGEVMEYDKGDMLFFGFIEKGSIESLRVTKKLHARIKNLCDENDPKGIMDIIDRELENIFVNIQEEQLEAVENWQKTLK